MSPFGGFRGLFFGGVWGGLGDLGGLSFFSARFKKSFFRSGHTFTSQNVEMKVEDILSGFDEKTVMIAQELRGYLLKTIKGVMEIPDNSAKLIGYGFGTGYKDLICVIMLSKKGVKLGLNRGAELHDPKKLLTGSGKVHRYVEIKTIDEVKNPAVKDLINEALKAYQKSSITPKANMRKK